MTESARARAAELVMRARAGEYGQEGTDWLALLQTAHQRGQDADRLADRERAQREGVEREANALAAVVADLLDGKPIDDVVDDLPHDARRRVLAYRHHGVPGPTGGLPPRDQFGPLPKVPPRASVMRERVRVVDVEPPTREEPPWSSS